MNKKEIVWLKKLTNLTETDQLFFSKHVNLKTNSTPDNKELVFYFNSLNNENLVQHLQQIQTKIQVFFSLRFVCKIKDLTSVKNQLANLIHWSNERFDLLLDHNFYVFVAYDESTEEFLRQPKILTILHLLGLDNDDSPIISLEKKADVVLDTLPELSSDSNVSNNSMILKNNQAIDLNAIVLDYDLTTVQNLDKTKKYVVVGQIFKSDSGVLGRSNTQFFKFWITNLKFAIVLKVLLSDKNKQYLNFDENYLKTFKVNDWIKAEVRFDHDQFERNDLVGQIIRIFKIDEPAEFAQPQEEENQRVEFGMHTNMSAFDGLDSAEQILQRLNARKIKQVVVSDFNSVQSFPALASLSKKYDVQVSYGAEFQVPNAKIDCVYHATDTVLNENTRFVFFDLETTGLSPNYDSIIEFGAYVTDFHQKPLKTIQQFIFCDQPLSSYVTNLTRITNEDLANQPTIEEFLIQLQTFLQPNDVLIAHNGNEFDIKFLNAWCRKCGLKEISNPCIDTLVMARAFLTDLSYFSLGRISRYFGFEYSEDVAHRADADAKYLNDVFWKLYEAMPQYHNQPLVKWNELSYTKNLLAFTHAQRIALYAKFKSYQNLSSIHQLYYLISQAHTNYFDRRPLLSNELIQKYRAWFFYTNSALDSDWFENGLKESDEYIVHWMKQFDFVQIAPLSVYLHLYKLYGKEIVEDNWKHLMQLIKENHIKAIAVSNAYYCNHYEHQFHQIYITTKLLEGKNHRLYYPKHDLVAKQHPLLFVRSTKQMQEELMHYLKDEIFVKELVLDNPQFFYSQIEKDITPVQNGLFPPQIDGVEEKLKQEVFNFAKKQYGEPLPKLVKDRLDFELNIIIKNGYSVVYWISHLLVKQSLQDGFLVGSRGSVGSSLVATCLQITEINPLIAHYYCSKCHYFESDPNNQESGYDLPNKNCPNCNEILRREGQNIQFATFLGFDGDKIPDIDLNFSGLYQAQAHNFIREMFGKDKAFRAGTISTVAEKTAYGYVNNFLEKLNAAEKYDQAYIDWLALNCKDVKKTTGQHPGGIVVLPQYKEIYEFTPYNFPADDTSVDWYTTHFAFSDIHDNLLKFDILGHDDPTILKFLFDLTGINPQTIPTSDELVMSQFYSAKALKIQNTSLPIDYKNAAIGLPEFGTKFVREMLNETQPKTFSDLVRISGLSHGTDVWANNAQLLVKEGKTLTELVSCRDDVMNFLSAKGLEPITAFKIMEDIRKGKGLKPEYEALMVQHKVPKWYIDSCKKIVYLFPKAHAAAYVLTAWRIAWYKVYYPLQYYATYFGVRCENFDINTMMQGAKAIYEKMQELKLKKLDKKTQVMITKKEEDILEVLEVAQEMTLRGYEFTNLDLQKSDAQYFIVDQTKKALIPPFRVIDGLGLAAAQSIIAARNEKPFMSLQDFKERTKVNKTVLQKMLDLNIFVGLNDDNQLKFKF